MIHLSISESSTHREEFSLCCCFFGIYIWCTFQRLAFLDALKGSNIEMIYFRTTYSYIKVNICVKSVLM